MSHDDPIGICHRCGDITARYDLCDRCWYWRRVVTVAKHIDTAIGRLVAAGEC